MDKRKLIDLFKLFYEMLKRMKNVKVYKSMYIRFLMKGRLVCNRMSFSLLSLNERNEITETHMENTFGMDFYY